MEKTKAKAKEEKKKVVYMARLERFGYDLITIAETEAKARAAMMKEYRKTFREWNGYLDQEYVNLAKEEINIYEMPFGHVEWT